MTTIMIAVARLSTQAMAGSNNQKDRQAIEAAINDNIQLIQQADSKITVNRLKDQSDGVLDSTTLIIACGDGSINNNPASFLVQQIQTGEMNVEPPDIPTKQQSYNITRDLAILPLGATYITQITYGFNGPEKGISRESRVIEISPSFEAGCY